MDSDHLSKMQQIICGKLPENKVSLFFDQTIVEHLVEEEAISLTLPEGDRLRVFEYLCSVSKYCVDGEACM